MRSRPKVHSVGEEIVPSTDELLRVVSSALRGDRKQVRALVSKTGKRIEAQARKRVRRELDDTLAKLRGLSRPPNAARPSASKVAGPHGARLGAPTPLPPPTLRPVRIRLSNDRWVRGHLVPAAARRDDLALLRRIIASNSARAFAAIEHNARAIDQLARTQRKLAELVAELQARGELALLQGLFEALEGLELRLGKTVRTQRRALESQRQSLSRQQGALGKELRLQARSARIQKLNATATTMQTAAFGTLGSPLARNNLLLAGNDLLWSFFGDLLELLGLKQPGQTSAWGWLSPVASLATGQVALGGKQHQRFISGVATGFTIAKGSAVYSLSLQGRVAPALWPSFRRRDDVAVTATALDPLELVFVDARVQQGVLTITLTLSGFEEGSLFSDLVAARIAWMVDTGAPNG